MKKRYNPSKDVVEEVKPDNGLRNTIEEFYSRVGKRFPVNWNINQRPAYPVFDTADLPDGVTEQDVEQVLSNMKADGWF